MYGYMDKETQSRHGLVLVYDSHKATQQQHVSGFHIKDNGCEKTG